MSPWPQEWEELKATPHKVVSMGGFKHILLARGVELGEPWREVFILPSISRRWRWDDGPVCSSVAVNF